MDIEVVVGAGGELMFPDVAAYRAVARGKQSSLEASFARDLTSEDTDSLRDEPRSSTLPPSVQKLRGTHHRVAQLLALGQHNQNEISVITGYSPSRISILQNDPAFKELIAHYTSCGKEVFVNVQQKMLGVVSDAVDELQSRLDEQGETFTVTQLLAVVEKLGDRVPETAVVTKNMHLHAQAPISPTQLAEIKASVNAAQRGQIRKVEYEAQAALSDNRGAEGSIALPAPTSREEETSLAGSTSEGNQI